MRFIPALLLLCPAACLLAQNPPPKPAPAPQPQSQQHAAQPQPQSPQPQVMLQAEKVGKPAPNVPPDRVVISLGDVKITAAQFDQLIDTVSEQYRPLFRGPQRKQFADNVVRVLVMADEARRRKLDQTPAFKTQSGFAVDSVLAGALYRDISSAIKPGEADLKAYYEQHRKELEQVHARHILIRGEGSPVPVKPGQKALTDAEALAKAQEIRKKVLDGADFAQLALTESDDTGSAGKGGDLGFFRHGQMVPTFEEAAFKLKPGEISEPVKTQFGYHIIKVEEVKGYDELKPDLERLVGPEQTMKAIEDLQKKATVTLDPEFFGMEKK